ncbi:hypothetical protein [Mobilibacterium timonense]|uniref:hypothetical protein n=1 Tax=Mobilibacterium timonense TaxID=1871012 RepID=UPI003A8D42B7
MEKKVFIILVAVAVIAATMCSVAFASSGKKDSGAEKTLMGWQLKDGSYDGIVDGNNVFRNCDDCEITVSAGVAQVRFDLGDPGITQIYQGDAASTEEDGGNAVQGAGGVFTLNVDALNRKQKIAVYEDGKWEDCKVAFRTGGLKRSDMVSGNIKDGRYKVDVSLEGGSGRAHLSSPAVITARKGRLTARIKWSSEYYQYVQIGGVQFKKINKNGRSRMDIPVVLDQDIGIQALTTAMSTPHIIDYTIRFDSSSMKKIKSGK